MVADKILSDQVVHVKRGRMNQLGFEPLYNSYFDFYLDGRYFGKPLLQLEDVTFHLYLRKNLTPSHPCWRMPSIRQIKKKFSIKDKIEGMMLRLHNAHLLRKESGIGRGEDGRNTTNDYILSDPIPTLEEFLAVASEDMFGVPLVGTYHIDPVPEIGTPGVPEVGRQKQTSLQQTWDRILSSLKSEMLSATFNIFLADTTLEIEGTTVIIRTSNTFAHSWIENRMSDKLLKRLRIELSQELTELHCVG
jgi:hypothetical protein